MKAKIMQYERSWLNAFLLFCLGSLIGWLWEAAVYWIGQMPHPPIMQVIGEFRGVLHGPWVPIYGAGCVLICLLAHFTKKRLLPFFLLSSAVCAVLEYVTSWLLETLYHARWWDYSNQLFNLNGRISALSVFFFGIAGAVVAFFLKPIFDKWLSRMPLKQTRWICFLLAMLFIVDCVYSLIVPNMGIRVDFIGRVCA